MRRIAVFLLMASACAGQAQQIQVSPANRTIAVTATEQAERRADTAVVHIGYQLYAATSEQVTQEAAKRSNAITDALKQAGVPEDAVESEGQGTGPNQDFQNGLDAADRANRRFQAQQSWLVHTDAGGAPKILDAAVSAGANQSGAISWSVADETSLSAEAAGKALKHAQMVAEQMAAGLNAKLGPLVYASNEALQLGILPFQSRAAGIGPGAGGGTGGGVYHLALHAPMVRKSATVSAVFTLQ